MRQVHTSQLSSTKLCRGELIALSGTIYTARDAAHARLVECINSGRQLPFELDGAVIYYAGPTPTPPGQIIGSCGPTTSSRMDDFTPALLARGVKALIGKGQRSQAVLDAIAQAGAHYLLAVGGCGALYASTITNARLVAYADLGCEAICQLTVSEMPLMVN